jgi:hypothetical protein
MKGKGRDDGKIWQGMKSDKEVSIKISPREYNAELLSCCTFFYYVSKNTI